MEQIHLPYLSTKIDPPPRSRSFQKSLELEIFTITGMQFYPCPELRSKFSTATATATASLRFAVNRKRQPQQLWNEEKVKGGPFSFSKKFCKIFVCGQRPDRNRNRNSNRDRKLAVAVNRNHNSGYENFSFSCNQGML